MNKETRQEKYSILCAPNLQGEQTFLQLNNAYLQSAPIKESLNAQIKELQRLYQEHHFLLGTSFGGIAAWLFLLREHPQKVQGLILLDVLPSLAYFPRRKRVGYQLVKNIPSRIIHTLYTALRQQQEYSGDLDIKHMFSRVQSIYDHFPTTLPQLPILVLSKNQKFHEEWSKQAKAHPFLTAQRIKHPSLQIDDWLNSIAK